MTCGSTMLGTLLLLCRRIRHSVLRRPRADLHGSRLRHHRRARRSRRVISQVSGWPRDRVCVRAGLARERKQASAKEPKLDSPGPRRARNMRCACCSRTWPEAGPYAPGGCNRVFSATACLLCMRPPLHVCEFELADFSRLGSAKQSVQNRSNCEKRQ